MVKVVTAHLIASSVNRVVVGLGVTGLSCARYLHSLGTSFSVIDTRNTPPGLEQLKHEMPEIPVFGGDYPVELIQGATEIIVSPGIAMDDPIVQCAQQAGVAVIGDIDLFMREATCKVIGITGSNAKSTVTELVGQMAREAGLNVGVGGNLGTPALELLASDRQLYVLELSSFQLERTDTLGLSVATVLNVTPDHLDRHGNLPRYHQAKHRIFRGCSHVVVNRDDRLTIPLLAEAVEVTDWTVGEPALDGFGLREESGRLYLSYGFERLLAVDEMTLVGRHNIANALAALALGHSAGLNMDAMLQALRTFQGLPHRCEAVATLNDICFVDDSKGTNVGATVAALEGLGGERNIVLIAGGQAKGADFSQLRKAVTAHCKQLVLIGEDAALLQQALRDVTAISVQPDMSSAVRYAASTAAPGDTVLLSPACASFDMFTGYVARGQAFASAVRNLPGVSA